MDINTLRSAVTLLLLLMFLAIVVWVYSRKRDQRTFDEIAELPLQGEMGEPNDK
ncbi:CcoQ/FixQ family Cbb3-type cytochrome c oxidase assembly chaperone [Paucibacter sp. PLA-PC-4]|uniref:cbb3-type cytochrome oxidase subunit 3 n=1 Tax=Paucibacter sp. PLA-PC-4 TaxID=2993655 RepID=UPI00224A7D51|nr:CcoQ/FixQ family Cbb3-type cytochrome c oxidase assembly chaperone [Paucibacter sp. PLA-PC-4]MCX2864221.1 CcoQ/FixQ family Cbb3-type cytochrome c oxidase assembly chaperone [Paucibacter sp. PLA-PC-4]